MPKEFNTLVFIGRFQPIHMGHVAILKKAAKLADNVLVLVGSSFQPRTLRNPFTFDERRDMIENAWMDHIPFGCSLYVSPIRDIPYNDNLWVEQVQKIVSSQTKEGDKIGLIGHSKDQSSFYLKLFPNWGSVDVPAYTESATAGVEKVLCSTEIRKEMYWNRHIPGCPIPRGTLNFLNNIWNNAEIQNLRDEFHTVLDYHKSWEAAPYPPTFVTADAVVIQAGHILLVKRRASPGKGLFALPGGFINQDETVQEAAIRELIEETTIDCPPAVLKGKIEASRVFDYPKRSIRGRTITHAFLFDLSDEVGRRMPKKSGNPLGLTKVVGADDAEKAFWLPISELREEEMFEDHYAIIQTMLGGM